jgi:hypothetical protein
LPSRVCCETDCLRQGELKISPDYRLISGAVSASASVTAATRALTAGNASRSRDQNIPTSFLNTQYTHNVMEAYLSLLCKGKVVPVFNQLSTTP